MASPNLLRRASTPQAIRQPQRAAVCRARRRASAAGSRWLEPFGPIKINPPHADIRDEQEQAQLEQPFPEVARLVGAQASVPEGVLDTRIVFDQGREQQAAARLGDASQKVQVRLGGIELGE